MNPDLSLGQEDRTDRGMSLDRGTLCDAGKREKETEG